LEPETALLAASDSHYVQLFDNQLRYPEFAHIASAQFRTAYRELADSELADGQRADRNRAQCERSDRGGPNGE
jgi:hypothetical protein